MMIQTVPSIFFILLLLLLHLSFASSTANARCWSYNGVLSSSVSPSNWISSNGDILFHLTFRKALRDGVLIMNDHINGQWGTEIAQSLPFVGDANVHVTISSGGDSNGVEAAVVVVITNRSNPNDQTQTYRFLDRNNVLSRSIASVTGAASGKETDCRTNPATPSPTTSPPYPCPTPPKPFRDDFRGDRLDGTKWLVAHRTWGGGNNGYTNGGVVYENVKVHNGSVVFHANGSQYTGPIKGIDRDLNRKPDGKRTGGAIATRNYFGPGRYEVRMKACPEFGACSAAWTFFYKDVMDGGTTPIINHEIDVEIPGRPAGPFRDIDFDHALLNVWVGETDYTPGYTNLPSRMDDGAFHTWRFDWHTGSEPRVEFYLDGSYLRTIKTHVPFYHQRIWLGVWFPGFWAGDADFDTSRMEVDWVEYSPFEEEVYQCPEETFPDYGWAPKTEAPTEAPTVSVSCTDFKTKKMCEKMDGCIFGKKKIFGGCGLKKKFSIDCTSATSSQKCQSMGKIGVCEWKDNNTCVSRCDGLVGSACKLKKGSIRKKKICKLKMVKNPCHKCQPITTCG